MKQLTFITSNKDKLEQVKTYLKYPIEHVALDLIEIQSLDSIKIAEHKAKEAYKIIKKPVLIEDTSLVFNALGGLPGPFIKWFYDALGPEELYHLLDAYEDKSAFAWIIFVYYDGNHFKIFDAKQEGTIVSKPRGENGFGWNPIFVPLGHIKTYAEMNDAEKREHSLRKRALIKLETYLKEHEQ